MTNWRVLMGMTLGGLLAGATLISFAPRWWVGLLRAVSDVLIAERLPLLLGIVAVTIIKLTIKKWLSLRVQAGNYASVQTHPLQPIARWMIALGATIVLLAGIGSVLVLWNLASTATGSEVSKLRIDAVKVGLSVAAGTGGAAALLLAVRRQWLSERDQQHREQVAKADQEHREDVTRSDREHRERVAESSERDATERRVTDLYAAAADQLASDKPAVRLAGFYVLERIAQGNPTQRQTIVNVICAYLRMPFTPPVNDPSNSAKVIKHGFEPRPWYEREESSTHDSVEELQVRLTAQRIISDHLTLPERSSTDNTAASAVKTFWPDVDLDLTGACLVDFKLVDVSARHAIFENATFHNGVDFTRARFTAGASFEGVEFLGRAKFDEAVFARYATFDHAKFNDEARFVFTEFVNRANFMGTRFGRIAVFAGVVFHETAMFGGADFYHLSIVRIGGISWRCRVYRRPVS